MEAGARARGPGEGFGSGSGSGSGSGLGRRSGQGRAGAALARAQGSVSTEAGCWGRPLHIDDRRADARLERPIVPNCLSENPRKMLEIEPISGRDFLPLNRPGSCIAERVTALRNAWIRVRRAAAWRSGRRWPLAVRIVCWTLFGLEFVYLVGANVFLNCNLLPLAFAGTNQVKATIRGGWTLIPERVHVRSVRITFQDHNLEFSIDMAHAFLVVHLSELLQHTFHGSHLRGDGVVFRMRNRVDPWSAHDLSVAALPPIREFRSPAVYEAYVPEPPISDAAYNLWSIHLDDVDVGVSEAWAEQFRYRGQGRARGQFELRPARWLWVGPASLDLDPGVLSAGPYRVAPGLHGRVECTVYRFDVRSPKGMQPLRYISAHIRLDSPALDPRVYALFASDPTTRVVTESGSLHLDVETQHGFLTPSSRLEIVQRGFQLSTVQGELNAERLEFSAGSPGTGGSEATLIVDHGIVKEAIAPGYPPLIEHLSVTVRSSNRDTTAQFPFEEARLNEARLALRDANWFNRWLQGPGFGLSGGGASVLARGRYAAGRVNGEALLETNGIAARFGEKQVRYAGSVALRVMDVDPQQSTGAVFADLTGRTMRAELGNGEFDLAGLRVRVNARRDALGGKLHAEAQLDALSSHGMGLDVRAPELNLIADSTESVDGAELTRFNAEIPSLRAIGRGVRLTTGALARGTFAQSKNKQAKRLDVTATLLRPNAVIDGSPMKKAETPRVEVHAALASDAAGALSGTVALLPAAWRVDSGNMRFSGLSALNLQLTALDLARQSGNIGARLRSTGVTLGDTTQNADCPWSRVEELRVDAQAKLAPSEHTAVSVNGEFGQTQLDWGNFITHADVGLTAQFDQGLFGRDGTGSVRLNFRNASLQSAAGADKGWAAKVPALDVAAHLAQRAGKMSGTAQIKADGAHGRIGETRVNTDLSADLRLDTLDLSARTAHASGNVSVRNTAIPNAPDPVSNWWANVKLDSLYGHAGKNLELGGTFRANLRDATPGLAVLAEQGSLPKWIATAFPLRDLSVTGSLARRCRLTDIHLVQLSGGPAVARGRLQSVPDGFQGALLLRLAGFQAISVGLDFDANHTHIGLFDGDAWLARFSQSFDRQSDAAVKLVCPPDPNQCTDGNDTESASVTASSNSSPISEAGSAE
jgi:hypothetical protein